MKNRQMLIQRVRNLNKDYVFAVGIFSAILLLIYTLFGDIIGFSASSFYGSWTLHLMGIFYVVGIAYKMMSFMTGRMTEESDQEKSLTFKSFLKSVGSTILLVNMAYVVILNSLLLGTFLQGLYAPVFAMTIGVPFALSILVMILELVERKMNLRV